MTTPSAVPRRRGRPPTATAAGTRGRILQAAREVFSECGYEAATFQTIARRAGLTRPAVCHHYAGKSQLYSAVVEQTTATVISPAVLKAQHQPTLLAKLSTFFASVMSAESAAAAFLVTTVFESRRHPEFADSTPDALQASREFVAWALDDAVSRGEVVINTDVGETVEMLLAAMWGMGFYVGYVSAGGLLGDMVDQFERLMASKLWQLGSPVADQV
ncbi:TetR/AcrR family transcriptional regulator [Mycolicibacterium brisbanense]|uniref:TetR/AcrR family transcriptional regulator n=1 Tax=Mycolicibacterium brisbanense TaxID=146020 RepID=UPI001F3196AF|nr:TetR/AcrR family transcriptional regulator [Mycolicibacterium brisbanense]